MSVFSTRVVQLILKVLRDKGVNMNCSRCNHSNFDLADGYYNIPETVGESTTHTDSMLPAVILYCTNCGFLTHHSLNMIGLEIKDGELIIG